MTSVISQFSMDEASFPRREFPAGTTVFHEGEPGDCAYIVDSGVIEICKATAAGELATIALLKRGSIFGELALVSNMPRSASAKAVADAVCHRIEKAQFDSMMETLQPFPRLVLQQLIRSLRRLTNIYSQGS